MSKAWLTVAAALGLGAAGAWGQGLPPAMPPAPAPVMLPPVRLGAGALAGGVAPGAASPQPLAISLDQAIQRGLLYNLAALEASTAGQQARAQRMAALSALLPQVEASSYQVRQKLNLAAFGFSFPGINPIVGPFNVFQASAAVDVPVVNVSGLQNARAARQIEQAAQSNLTATRDLVVLAVANQYLLTVADQSRVTAAQAELATAESALQQASDMLRAGTVDRLAVVRAQVQRDRQQQQLTAAQDALAKQRLQLARAIGLPPEQGFDLTSAASFEPLTPPAADAAVAEALATRADYRGLQAQARAAALLIAAARDQRLPQLSLNGNWGTIGHELDSNHPIYSAGATLSLPVFSGGRTRADILQAQAQYHDVENRLADLRTQINVEVRSALLDLQNNRDQVRVAADARSLAEQELTLAQDRFRAGVADNLEVVQAQQAVADDDESYISSLYGYNLAKATLAQALGVAANSYRNYLPVQ